MTEAGPNRLEGRLFNGFVRLMRNQLRTSPIRGDVDERAEEEEHDELGKAALHGVGPSRLRSITNEVSVARTTMVPLITVL